MALIMYLTKAPRYKNIVTDEYETVPRKDIELIEKYLNWQRARFEERTDCDTLKDWCGVAESDMPHKYIINYYRNLYTIKEKYLEYAGNTKTYSIFDQLARIAKANQLVNWFVKNVMGEKLDQEYYEVTEKNLKDLLEVCRKVKENCTLLPEKNDFNQDDYIVNEAVAKELLPIMEEQGYFFGTDQYDWIYAQQVVDMVDILENALSTTDFEKETVYFNTVW